MHLCGTLGPPCGLPAGRQPVRSGFFEMRVAPARGRTHRPAGAHALGARIFVVSSGMAQHMRGEASLGSCGVQGIGFAIARRRPSPSHMAHPPIDQASWRCSPGGCRPCVSWFKVCRCLPPGPAQPTGLLPSSTEARLYTQIQTQPGLVVRRSCRCHRTFIQPELRDGARAIRHPIKQPTQCLTHATRGCRHKDMSDCSTFCGRNG